MDNALGMFVRKYSFDFPRVAKALRAFVEHVLQEVDGEELDSSGLTADACRRRWALLDQKEYERRQQISQQLNLTKQALDTQVAEAPTPPKSTSSVGSGDSVPRGYLGSSTATRVPARPLPAAARSPPVSPPPGRPRAAWGEADKGVEGAPGPARTVPSAKGRAVGAVRVEDPVAAARAAVASPQAHEKEDLELKVKGESLEKSNFTIFTHDLKAQCDGFYEEVRTKLPSIEADDSSSDSDVEPVFSNLRVDPETCAQPHPACVFPLFADCIPVLAAHRSGRHIALTPALPWQGGIRWDNPAGSNLLARHRPPHAYHRPPNAHHRPHCACQRRRVALLSAACRRFGPRCASRRHGRQGDLARGTLAGRWRAVAGLRPGYWRAAGALAAGSAPCCQWGRQYGAL